MPPLTAIATYPDWLVVCSTSYGSCEDAFRHDQVPQTAAPCYTGAAHTGQMVPDTENARLYDEVDMRRTLRSSRLFRRKDFYSYFTGAVHKALIGIFVLLGTLALVALGTLHAPHALADSPELQIVVPVPSSSAVAQGPVGTNVSITAQIPTAPNDSYQIGWAPQSGTCATNFSATSLAPIAADGSGNLSATFAWPNNANTIGASYYVCALDATNPGNGYFQSAQLFQVAASSKPSITVSGQSSTGLKGIFVGGTLQLNGDQFLPGGTKLYVFLNSSQAFAPSDLQPNQALPTTEGSDITSGDDGGFSATVKVPDDSQAGALFLHVVSSDGTPDFPPALVATKQITIALAPTPTPNPTPTLPANPGGGGQSNTNGSMPAIIGLGVLSVVLFVLGVILIATVATSPSPGNSNDRPSSGTRY